jgi:uncharacterized membrane protein
LTERKNEKMYNADRNQCCDRRLTTRRYLAILLSLLLLLHFLHLLLLHLLVLLLLVFFFSGVVPHIRNESVTALATLVTLISAISPFFVPLRTNPISSLKSGGSGTRHYWK